MGSAESSTLQSVESLSATLDEINRKLIVIEDIHLHHERVTCTDETIIVHGKRVKCLSTVEIVVGPIVGLIGEDFIRVLLEVNRDTEVTLNVFSTQNDLSTQAQFVLTTVRFTYSISLSMLIKSLIGCLIYTRRWYLLLPTNQMCGMLRIFCPTRITSSTLVASTRPVG